MGILFRVCIIGILIVIGIEMNIADLHARGLLSTSDLDWGTMSEGFKLSAKPEKVKLAKGDSVLLFLTIKNVTRRKLSLVETDPERQFQIEIRNNRGQRAKMTEIGQRVMSNAGTEFRMLLSAFAPGESKQIIIDVTRLYELNAAGTYSIIVIRKVPKVNGRGEANLVSNIVKVQIAN